MVGDEFCGNAARSAAILISEIYEYSKVSFTMSGYDGKVSGEVKKKDHNAYYVKCTFPSLSTKLENITLSNSQAATMVDLDGIVHVVMEKSFPNKTDAYESIHRKI